MSTIRSNNKTEVEWFKHPWTKLTASVIAVAAIFGIGFEVGSFKESLEWKVEKIQLVQEFNEKFQKQIEDCRNLKIEEYNQSSEELKRMIDELNKRLNEK